ncbi:dockerin type I domain-containing protein [Clostridium cibarium]|uniref:Transglutaminase-like domain-containing protein n=1 Tax=Clostridium cibarium TaxID=2762247 RepID=A0ABR8PPU7_9CLOT|nr:dockerin type I domain-containing protein [Clostridium cibarium]MBD7910189.1 hypothetical protein [Clostridium cibarium]
MKKVSKILFFILSFNLITFLPVSAEIVSGENVNIEASSSQNLSGSKVVQGSMNLDQYMSYKEYPTTLTQTFNAYTGLKSASIGEQQIIAAIKTGLENLQTRINLDNYIQYFSYKSQYKLPMEYYFDTLYEYPEIFYPNLSVDCEAYVNSSDQITSYTLKVTYSNDNATISTMKTAFNNKVQEVKNNYLSTATTALEKEYAIHDYIIKNTTYDMENYKNNTIPNISHTAYGSLVNGVAVCDGYSKAAQLFLRDSGIESGIVVSEAINHAWNFIKLDGYYYFLDLTWDDPDRGDWVSYKYFNATDAEMKSGTSPHVWDEQGYPSAVNSTYSFLRSGDSYKRYKDKLYYSDIVNKTYLLNSVDLKGANKTLVYDADYVLDLEVYKNNAYCASAKYDEAGNKLYYVYRLNLTNKDDRVIFVTSGQLNDISQSGSNLVISYAEGGISKTETVSIAYNEDVNSDGVVDMLDLAILGNSYNAKAGTSLYKASYDVNSDSIIDIYDITKVATEFKL